MDANQLIEQALSVTGAGAFEDTSFMPGLQRFLQIQDDLTDVGKAEHREMLERWLRNRALLERDWKAHPEILQEDVSDPLVVLGMARSGSTAFQRMLSADPNVQSLYTWQTLNPAPLPGEGPHDHHLRRGHALQLEEETRAHNADHFAAHAMLADDAEEDTLMHFMTFRSIQSFALAPANGDYIRWLRSQDRAATYAYIADCYRHLQWQGGGKKGRPWVMKSPQHMGCLDALLAAHPKATFIYLVRDYTSVFASTCRLFEVVYKDTFKALDPVALGRVQLDFWAHELQRLGEARRRLGDKLRLMELPYTDLIADPLGSARKAYAFAGLELTPEGERSIAAWVANNPQGKHGKHDYNITDYGVTTEQVAETFRRALAGELAH